MPLHPQIKAYLDRESASGAPPRSELTIDQIRELSIRKSGLAGKPVPLPVVRDTAVPGPAGDIPVRIYRPDQGVLPVFVYLHGGRFISGNLDTHDSICRALAAEAGCMVVAVDYRLSPEHKFPAAVYDSYSVTEWLESHGGEIDADPRSIGIGGDSAGGNLAASVTLLALRKNRPSFRCQVLVYPMLDATCSLPSHQEYASGYGPGSYDMRLGYKEYLPSSTDPKHPLASPLWSEGFSGLPPALVLTAEFDSLRDDGESYVEYLREAGIEVVHTRYDGAIHGFFQMAGEWELGKQAISEVAEYLREFLVEL